MNCKKCSQKALITKPEPRCKEHFLNYVENKVKETIENYQLITKKDKVCVAASGGKDSMTVLYLLKKLGYQVEALAVDEGIHQYRDETLKHLQTFCDENQIKLNIVSYKQEYGVTLDEVTKTRKHPCSVCGVFRRKLLNNYSKNYDVLATGHNLDDESQAILMNLFKNQVKLLLRAGPTTSKQKGMTRRIKPLYFLSEKEIATYALLLEINPAWNECPNVTDAYRKHIRDYLNEQELVSPGSKMNIAEWSLNLKKEATEPKGAPNNCKECNDPCSGTICKACKMLKEIRNEIVT